METAQLADRLVWWLGERVRLAEARGVIVGMSGGIDSAVTARLCQVTFPENVLALIMPCHSSEDDERYARMVTDKFAIPAKKVVLDNTINSLLTVLPADCLNEETGRLALANLKPRLRMISLYYVANQLRYLVVGSGNRSEITVGYFAKYGDGGVDILPLGNLVKTQVRELAVFLDIPQPIIDRPPTAGLWSGQTDEGEMGITYRELDSYITSGQASPEVKVKIEAMTAASEHKRHTPPLPDF